MVITKTDRLFVKQLKEAGEKLVHPPLNVNELLSLLDVVECCLLWITQPPSKTIENALGPLKKALVAEDLLRHSDIDVKVSVAACISELTRISAPAILYDDEQMRKVSRLIVDAFEGLSDASSRSYSTRVSILESMARDPSCAVLLNLKCCDAMIIEMFQHFLKSIRDYHPKHVFSDMETIMTLVLKESDDLCFELLSLLVDSVRKKGEYVLPIRQKLAKKVIRNCFAKFKPDMIHHESVFAAECNRANANASGEHPANGSESLEKAGADRIPQEANKVLLKVFAGSVLWDLALGRSFQRVMTNGDTQIGSGDSLTYPSSPQKKPRCTDRDTDEAKTTDTAEQIEADNLESKTVFIPGQAIKKTRAYAIASDEHPVKESKSLEKAGADRIPQRANKVSLKATGSGLLDHALGRSSLSVVINDDSLTYPSSPQKKPQCTDRDTDEAKTTDTAEKIEPYNLESKTVFMPETEPGQAIKKTREVHNQPERSFDSSNNRELDAAHEWVEAEKKLALIEGCEQREKTNTAYKANKKLSAFESRENRKKAALEAEMKKIEEQPGRKKAEYLEKMKNKVALIDNDAEEKRAMIKAKYGEEILKAEEIAGKCQASGATPATPMTLICLICLLFAFGGGLLIGYWISEIIV